MNKTPLLSNQKEKRKKRNFLDFFKKISIGIGKKKNTKYKKLDDVFDVILSLEGGYSIPGDKICLFYDIKNKKNKLIVNNINYMYVYLIEAVRQLKQENSELFSRIEVLEKIKK